MGVRLSKRLADFEEIHYPFTLFIYINYVGSGGKSMSWDQLAEMRDAGVDIESHTIRLQPEIAGRARGSDGRRGHQERRAALGIDGWLHKEIIGSKEVLENKLASK